ncbi:glycoside hydrolase family 13 protein [Bacillus sp. 1P06AnD]|uniref:glycoside hydrolase family 13 protein n=1 Tax=Bacillus sp. 1P06AnD TaxID=3132208 RepID=UPI0039A0F5EF
MITRTALYHRGENNYCYGYDKNTLHIRVRLAKKEATQVSLRIGDPYKWASGGGGGNLNAEGAMGWIGGTTIPMQKEAETELYEYWVASYMNDTKRFRYAFIVEDSDEKLLFGEKKIVELEPENEEAALQEMNNFFCMPYMNGADVADIPSWVNETVWYQIFPERFANGNPDITPKDAVEWGSEPTPSNMMGGDLYGVLDRLDYLQELGITGIYFCPIFHAESNHKYDTIDYMEIDPQFGDKAVFKKLVEEAHKRGIRIMLDAVFNHAGWQSPFFQDVLKNQEASRYKDWFHIKSFPVSHEAGNYEMFAFCHEMPKFNTENEECRAYLLDVARYWVEEFDIDGWRLDVANEVDHVFWRDFRNAVKAIKPDLYILGELWHDAMPWLQGDQFDAVMDYPVGDAITEFICHGKMNAEQYKHAISEAVVRYPRNMNEATFALLDSHDTDRIVTRAGGNLDKVKLAYLLLFSYTGSPSIYYGGEIGLEGGADPGCRRAMPWKETEKPNDFNLFMKKLIHLRKTIPAFRSQTFKWIKADRSDVLIFCKEADQGDVYFMINTGNKAVKLQLPEVLDDKLKDLFNEEEITLPATFELGANEYYVLQK